ncbi:MAG: TonB-dependent receptor, partial [Methylocystis sp.]|nr:TonB-dependent receptor [Methylocystis sp.]
FNPNPDLPFTPTPFKGTNKLEIETVAGYLYDSIHLHPQWILSGGARVERYRLKIGMKDAAGLPTGQYDGYTDSPTMVSGKVGLVYKPVENASLFGAVGWSNEPVGANFLTSPDISRGDDRALATLVRGAQPFRMVNYELGAKWSLFDGRLSTTLALFHTVRTVPITGCFGNPPGLPGAGCIGGAAQPITLKGYGDQIAQGVEFGVSGNVTDNWQVFGGFLIMQTERKHDFLLDWFRMAASPNDYPVFGPGVDAPAAFFNGFYRRGTNGDQLSFTPNVTGNFWTTYRLPETPVTVGGGMIYSSESWAGRQDYGERIVPNGRFGKLPSYFVVNLMTSFELYKDVFLTLNVDNVANRKFAVATNNNAQRAVLWTPRAYRFGLNFRF